MPEIVVSDKQARIIVNAKATVAVRDRQGQLLARIPPRLTKLDAAMIRQAGRRLRSGRPRYATTAAMHRFRKLIAK